VNAVEILLELDHKDCKGNDKFPLWVLIGNASGRVINKTEFTLEGRRKGRSTNVVEYRVNEDDHILEPRTGWGVCYALPKIKAEYASDGTDPKELEWSVGYKRIYFQD
jgi:hypothetical protein